jgi:hypothetical protein
VVRRFKGFGSEGFGTVDAANHRAEVRVELTGKLAQAKSQKGNSNRIHAQFLLRGQKVDRDEMAGMFRPYYFDRGYVRSTL